MYIVFSEWCYLIGNHLVANYIPMLFQVPYSIPIFLLQSNQSAFKISPFSSPCWWPLLAASTDDSVLPCSSFKQRMNVQGDGWRTDTQVFHWRWQPSKNNNRYINYFLLVANYILLVQKFEIYDENLNRLMKIIEIFVDSKIRRINRIIVEKICFNSYFCYHSQEWSE